MPRLHSTTVQRPAILLALGPAAAPTSRRCTELRSLIEGLGYSAVGEVRQRRHERGAAMPLGSGKLSELRELISRTNELEGEPIVACASDLSSGHLRNLERELGAPVIDRTEVILRVFESRAESPLAKLEIERARLVHSLPRIRDTEAARRQEGGGGRAAKGHSNTELAKQAASRRIAELGRRIEVLKREQERRVQRRREVLRVAFVGYTNVGKSSWMEALTGREVGVKDALFHTLGTRVHALGGAGRRILVADTVGFLDGLPHTLVESFHSTLAEALDADLLLHVVAADSPDIEAEVKVTKDVLAEVRFGNTPSLLLLNKADLLTEDQRAAVSARYPDALLVSSHSDDDRKRVLARVREHFERAAQSETAEQESTPAPP